MLTTWVRGRKKQNMFPMLRNAPFTRILQQTMSTFCVRTEIISVSRRETSLLLSQSDKQSRSGVRLILAQGGYTQNEAKSSQSKTTRTQGTIRLKYKHHSVLACPLKSQNRDHEMRSMAWEKRLTERRSLQESKETGLPKTTTVGGKITNKIP